MKSLQEKPKSYEFYFRKLGTRVHVEEIGGAVVIRATRDSFSTERKISFIRELAAEGFIPDDYMWSPLEGEGAQGRGVVWLVDPSWLKFDEKDIARARRFMNRVLVGAVVLLAAEVALVFTGFINNSDRGPSADQAGQHSGPHWRR
jgi:hypothetical protein